MHKRSKLKTITLLTTIFFFLVGLFIKIAILSSKPKVSYITATATKGNIEQTVLADGSVEAFKLVNVGAQVSGQIKALHVKLGDRVTKGQLIAEIDDLTQQNNLKEAKANLDNLQAQRASKVAMLKFYQTEYARQDKLYSQRAGAKTDYDKSKATLDSTKADIEALSAQIIKAQISVDTANVNLGYTKITAPIEGIVVSADVEEGQTVNAVQSAPTIVQIAQLDTVTIKAQISEADVTKVSVGMPVYFTILDDTNNRFYGKLRKIEPVPSDYTSSKTTSGSTSTNAIYYNGLFDVPNTDGKLRISMTTQVYVMLKESKDAIIIPATALLSSKGNNSILQVVNSNGEIEQRKVTVGINDNVNAEILSGLHEGENVIISSNNGKSAMASNRGMRIRM